ncbi:TPA: 1-acyl-sn-glycerol-3-phosphate acyltransferase [Candidatus Berkelbacteria bacterium]|uniref:1-acyl-sn-glycerol-3-phosphate acyltransferase, 1-acyl-sn-glycerol-3-phosphate acyltransferase n=1 Tax=Berkelbacteria bacterium GW2011_GWE1_39_12 TaxID=1618337 RepID=A0A0G4B2R4_9BACT|nr:MAG: 1-acyl-sn-glycerol-3-phosphate acyltransferase, 1-acyl-sn-glycerol-3-phosphate acyltransferase [Berkelbacteria bacterium GW2011_GWE1_39_12]HBO60767.1 1-acyl-sn-glycerol-3-phosphate acyltransferase [Candidatus Berkelbacteria bacterium]
MVYFISVLILRVMAFMFWKIDWLNTSSIPKTGAVFFVSKHSSWKDIIIIGLVSKRPVHFVAKVELWQINRFISWWLNAVGAIPIDREHPDPSTFKRVRKLLKDGEVVAIFPEGTRNDERKITHFFEGVGVMSAKIDMVKLVPIVPDHKESIKRFGFVPAFHSVVTVGCATIADNLKSKDINDAIERNLKELAAIAFNLA